MMIEHPLKVYYPYGGRHYLMQFRTHDKQNQIILSRSERALLHTFTSLLKREEDFILKNVGFIEIVSPPEKACVEAIEYKRLLDIDQFCQDLQFTMAFYMRKGIQLPWPFAECKNWKPTETNDENETSDHYDCQNCKNKVSILIDKEEFYNRYFEKYQKPKHPSQKVSTSTDKYPKAVYSKARPSNDLEGLNVVYYGFGHRGLDIGPVDEEFFTYHFDPVMFYFVNAGEVNQETYQKIYKEFKEEQKRLDQERKRIFDLNFELRQKKEMEELFAIFCSEEK